MSDPSPLDRSETDASCSDSIDSALRRQPLSANSQPVALSGISSLVRDLPNQPDAVQQFQTTTTAPSPLIKQEQAFGSYSHDITTPTNALRISTDVPPSGSGPAPAGQRDGPASLMPSRIPLSRAPGSSGSILLARSPSLKGSWSNGNGFGSSSSLLSSPVINAMGDVTPLPSPLMASDSPGPWRRLSKDSMSPPQRRARMSSLSETQDVDAPMQDEPMEDQDQPMQDSMPSPKRKLYITTDAAEPPAPPPASARRHGRNRSISDYTPDGFSVLKRPVSVSGSHASPDTPKEPSMRRESNLAESRGLTPTVAKPPTPPPSDSSRDGNAAMPVKQVEFFTAQGRYDDKTRRWRCLGLLGRGTFSRVMLATSQIVPDAAETEMPPDVIVQDRDCHLDRKTLVAVKVCEHGPRGGASEDRVEMSLKRELEIMQAIRHPSVVNLRAWSIEKTRAILVMSYCPGGDLFDFATSMRNLLTPQLIQRIFSELVAAVSYLHSQSIVHRDIKLENVLVNLRQSELTNPKTNWTTYPYSVITLADLGLSRRIADGEQLETRCGSDDYAAPEVIMGQPYDGRATDAWSLGVLLYALLEARLPFDPHPSMSDAHRMRSRTSHRIARVEWRWAEYAGEDGDHEADEAKFSSQGLLGAMTVVEGLLKRARSRWTMAKVADQEWVATGLRVEGGLAFREEHDGAEV